MPTTDPRPNLGTCRLCNRETELRLSHIIPKFVTDWLKRTGSGYFRDLQDPDERLQDGRKVRLLCHECEQRFGRVESWFCARVFRPYVEHGNNEFDYGPELYRFLLSVLWRMAEVNDAHPHFADQVRRTREEWRLSLLEERVPRFAAGIHFSFTAIGTVDGRQPVVNFNQYWARSFDGDIANNEYHAFVYAKLARVAAFGEVTPIHADWMTGTRVSPVGGTHVQRNVVIDHPISEFLANRAAEVRRRFQSGTSDREKARIAAMSKKKWANIAKSDLGLAAAADRTAEVDPTPLMRGKVGRNDPCPCGSGKKFKRCHPGD